MSATVDDKLRIAEQLDHLGVQFIEGGWPGANPKDIEFFARAADRAAAADVARSSPSARPAGPAARSTTTPTLRNLRRGQHLGGLHRRQELRVPRDRGAADDARRGRGDDRRLGRVPRRPRPPGARRHRALLRRLQGEPRVLAPGARGGGRQGRQPPRAVRHQRRLAARTRSARSSRAVQRPRRRRRRSIGIHCHDDTGCAVANSMAAVAGRRRARAGHAQRARRAHRQRQPDHRSSRTSSSSSATRACPTAASSGSPRSATTSPRRSTGRSTRRRRTSARRRSPTRPGCTRVAIARAKDAYEHVDPEARRQRHPLRRVARWPGGRRSR